jgi:uncharacterized protein (TIGR02145 family)
MKTCSKISILLLLLVPYVFMNTRCQKDKEPPDQVSVTDFDGNVYKTVTIGTQAWMKENLKTIRYSNGDPIPNISDNTQWQSLSDGAFCYYENNVSSAQTYGLLYNWYAVSDSRNVCPEGWHVPTTTDWNKLVNFLGGEEVAADKLKEKGTAHWVSPNSGATDEYGFTALPGGFRVDTFSPPGYYAIWWSATPIDQDDAWIFTLIVNNNKTFIEKQYKMSGHAVRCVKD